MAGGIDEKPDQRRPVVQVRYGGMLYERDLLRCRRALLERLMHGGFGSLRGFAVSLHMSPAMVSAWFRGDRPGMRETTDRILAGLGLVFADVHRPVTSAGEEGVR